MKKSLRSLLLFLGLILLLFGCKKNDEVGKSNLSENKSHNLEIVEDSKKTSKEDGIVENADTHIVIDSIGREVILPNPITSAVVANAYNTEIINAIDSLDKVIGVDYNIYQDKESWKNRYTENDVIGKNQRELNYEKIIEKNPDVLILTGNGAVEEAIEKLSPFNIQVLVCDAYYTDEFSKSCNILGKVFGEEEKAKELDSYFAEKLEYINEQLKDVPKRKVYFEYRRIGNTTIPGNYFFNMVEFSHADNIFKESESVEVDPEAVIVKNPEVIVKVSAPDVKSSYFPPTEEEMIEIKNELINRPGWDEIDAVREDNILLLSHYVHGGASKLVGTMYLAKWLYPEQLPDLNPEEIFRDWLVKYQKLDYIEGHTFPEFNIEG